MRCTSNIVLNTRLFMLVIHTSGDFSLDEIPIAQRLNPLRYSLTLNPGKPNWRTFNVNGKLRVMWANFWWPLHPKHPRWRRNGSK